MTQIEPPSTTSGSPVPQAANDEVFSRATHDLVMEQINPSIQHTAIAWAIRDVMIELFAKIGVQIGASPNAAIKFIEYRNKKIRWILWKAANDDSMAQPVDKKAA